MVHKYYGFKKYKILFMYLVMKTIHTYLDTYIITIGK